MRIPFQFLPTALLAIGFLMMAHRPVEAAPPQVHVVLPNGGEQVPFGTALDVRWTATSDVAITSIAVDITRDGGTTFELLADNLPNSGSRVWTVKGPTSSHCRVRIRATNSADLTGTDSSDAEWTITQGVAPEPLMAAYLGSFGSAGGAAGHFSGPDGIALSDDGFIYVADTYNSRVQKFTLDGHYVSSFGTRGNGPGQFVRPYGIDVDAAGSVYVGDLDRHDVQKFSPSGALQATIGAGQLTMPFGLWVGDDGIVYVADPYAQVVRRFSPSGLAMAPIGPALSGGVSLIQPQNVEGDGHGTFYISDAGVPRVRVVNADGALLASYGSDFDSPAGSALTTGRLFVAEGYVTQTDLLSGAQVGTIGEGGGIILNTPLDCTASGDSLLLVVDGGNNRVVRYRLVHGTPPQVTLLAPNGGESLRVGTTAEVRWAATDDVAVTSVDLLLSRTGGSNYQIIAQELPNTGRYIWNVTGTRSSTCRLRVTAHDDIGLSTSDASDQDWTLLPSFSIPGLEYLGAFGTPELNGPRGIATSDDGFIYIADTFNARVLKFTAAGDFVGPVGVVGPGFQRPYGIDVDANGNVYVSDSTARRVVKFDRDGVFVRVIWNQQFEVPLGLYASDEGILYVTDWVAARVYEFTPDGVMLRWWPLGANQPQNIEGTWQGRFYVSDQWNPCWIRVVDTGPDLVASFGEGWVGRPKGIAVLGPMLLVTEFDQNRLTAVERTTGMPIATLGEADPSLLSAPFDVATLGDSLVYVLDTGHSRVLRYRNTLATPPLVTVVTPNGGETLYLGNRSTLRWSAESLVGVSSVELALSRDGGKTYASIASALANTGSYEWVVTSPVSAHCRVRVRALDSLTFGGQDASDADFRIQDRAVPTLLARFEAGHLEDVIELRWEVGVGVSPSACALERAESPEGPYSSLGVPARWEGRQGSARDSTVQPGRTYWYRMVLSDGSGQHVFGPITATLVASLSLETPYPAPARDDFRVDFALPRTTHARLSVIDVQGRQVALLADATMTAGRHSVAWSDGIHGTPLASGVFFVRLQVGDSEALHRRFVIAR